MTNQEIYSEYGIQPNDTNKIAQKLGIPVGNYSTEALEQIRAIYSEAKKSGLSLTKYLAEVEIAQQPSAPAPSATPRPDRVQAPVDESAVGDFHLTVRGAVSSIVDGSIQALAQLDDQLADHEDAVSTAFVERIKQSKDRSARLVISKLEHEDSKFFQLAPTGAAQTFAERASAILALPDSGVSQFSYAALKQATVDPDDQGIEQQG